MSHGLTGYRRAEIRDTRAAEASDIDGAEVRTAKRHAGEPGRNCPTAGEQQLRCDLIAGKSAIETLVRRKIAVIQQDVEFSFRRNGEDAVGEHMRAPEIAERVEGDPVDEGPVIGGAEGLAPTQGSIGCAAQTRDAPAARLNDIKPFFAGIETDFIGEGEPVCDDAQLPLVVERYEPVAHLRADSLHPIPNPRRDRDPQPILGIA
jgi:hypothetical protein